jgi:hypothetical protein
MKKWILKAIAQKAVSYLPAAHHINYLVHKYITKGRELPEDFFADRLSHFTNHYRYMKQFHAGASPALNVLELGTGWHPIVPIAFFLSGHTDIITIDIRPQLFPEMIEQTLNWFIRYADEGKLQKFVPDFLPEKVETLRKVLPKLAAQKAGETMEQLNIQTWHVDARNLPLPDNSRDLIVSNNVLQDIPSFILEGIFKEFKRIAKPDAVQSHFIDMTDQFSHSDTSITNFNYLQFPETTWKLLTNSLQAQNRERIPFYRNLYLNTGLKIVAEENNHGNLTDVKKVKLDPKFQAIPLEDVAVLHTHLVGKHED